MGNRIEPNTTLVNKTLKAMPSYTNYGLGSSNNEEQ